MLCTFMLQNVHTYFTMLNKDVCEVCTNYRQNYYNVRNIYTFTTVIFSSVMYYEQNISYDTWTLTGML